MKMIQIPEQDAIIAYTLFLFSVLASYSIDLFLISLAGFVTCEFTVLMMKQVEYYLKLLNDLKEYEKLHPNGVSDVSQ